MTKDGDGSKTGTDIVVISTYELKRDITLTRQDKMSVSAYYTKLKGIWDKIDSVSATPKCTCGKCTCNVSKLFIEKSEKERIYEFLIGLDDAFNMIKTQILSTKPMPSPKMAYHLVAEDERQRLISSSRSTTSSIHSINMIGKINLNTPWVIDSGATEHITHEGSIISSITNTKTGTPVKIPNGDEVPVQCMGTVSLPNGLNIEQVLHIPEFQCNLVSVSRLMKDYNFVLTFFPEFCTMQDIASRNLIGVGRQRDGLYLLESVGSNRRAFSVSVDLDLWHRRLYDFCILLKHD